MIEEEIRGEVNDADFYGHMVDETTDISTKNQMSVIVRFVKNGEVKERFLGFYNVSDLSGNLSWYMDHIMSTQVSTFHTSRWLSFGDNF